MERIDNKAIYKFLILFFVSIVSFHSYAQKTYIHTNSAYDVMQITREMCDEFHELWTQSDPKSIEIANRLILWRDKRLIYLVPLGSKTMLSYYFCDFEGILKDVMEGFDYHHYITDKKIKRKSVRPPHHTRLECYPVNVFEKVLQKRDSIITVLHESTLQPNEKDFLVLYLKTILEQKEIIPEQMNRECDAFLTKHPDSEYALYVNRILNIEYKTRDIGLGTGFFFGYHFLGGNISNYMKPPMSIGAYIDVAYKRFILKPDITVAPYRHNKKGFNYQDVTYTSDSSSFFISGNLNAGYILWDNSNFRVTPFLGIGKQTFAFGRGDARVIYKTNLNIGAEFEWKFSHFKIPPEVYFAHFYNQKVKTYWALFLRLGYSNLNFSDPFFGGSMFYMKIGIGFNGNNAKRVYK